MTQEDIIARFGEKTIADWKKEHAPRSLVVIVVEDKCAVLKPVGAMEVANFSMMVANPSHGLVEASKYLITELWLDGDNELTDDEEYFTAAMMQVQKAVEVKKSSSFKL